MSSPTRITVNIDRGRDGTSVPVSTDSTFTANSDLLVPSQKAVKTAMGLKLNLTGGDLTGPLSITTDTGTYDQAYTSHQIGPSSGTAAGPFFFNHVVAEFYSALTGTGLPGDPGSATLAGFQFNLNVGGANFDVATAMGISVGLIHLQNDTSDGDKNAASFGVYSNATSPGKIYGGSSAFTIGPNGEAPLAVGWEVDTVIETGAVLPIRIGIHSWSGGDLNGTDLDSAYGVGTTGAVGKARWKKWFTMFNQGGITNNPLDDDADFFYSDHTATVANIFNLENVDVTGHILRFPHVHLSGDGTLTLGSTVEAGGIGLGGPAATALLFGFEQNAVVKWQFGIGANADIVFSNTVLGNVGFRIASATNAITALGTINSATINEDAWTDYTPAVDASSGAITTYSVVARYKRTVGRTVHVMGRITLTTVGTAAALMRVDLPINARFGTLPYPCVWGKTAVTGVVGLTGSLVDTDTLSIQKGTDGSSVFAGGDGTLVDFEITYEAAA